MAWGKLEEEIKTSAFSTNATLYADLLHIPKVAFHATFSIFTFQSCFHQPANQIMYMHFLTRESVKTILLLPPICPQDLNIFGRYSMMYFYPNTFSFHAIGNMRHYDQLRGFDSVFCTGQYHTSSSKILKWQLCCPYIPQTYQRATKLTKFFLDMNGIELKIRKNGNTLQWQHFAL